MELTKQKQKTTYDLKPIFIANSLEKHRIIKPNTNVGFQAVSEDNQEHPKDWNGITETWSK